MRLAILGDEVSQDLEDVVRLCVQHGFEGVEIRSVWGKSPLELGPEDCRRIAATLQEAGLEVANFAPPALKSELPRTASERARARDGLARSLERAEWLGAPSVRVFSFYHDGQPNPAAAADEMHEAFVGCAPPAGCTVLLENGMRTNNPNAETTAQLLAALDGSEVEVLWDPGNAWFSGWDRQPFTVGYELLRDRIGYVHVKDPVGSSGYTRLGDGDLDWGGIIDRLSADGFSGWLSLETHWRPDRVLSQRERDVPHGEGFSTGGYPASDECMRVLAALARRTDP
jgi:sugar phosphate isomerase/epimerase